MKNYIDYKEELRILVQQYPKHYAKMLKHNKNYYELYTWILQNTQKLADPYYKLSTKVYWILNDIIDFPICSNESCKKPIYRNVRSITEGYNKLYHDDNGNIIPRQEIYCNSVCAGTSQKTKNKTITTNNIRYNADYPMQCQWFQDEITQTSLSKYNVKRYSMTEEWLKKYEATSNDKYGANNIMQTDIGKIAFRNSCLKTLNVEHPSQSHNVRLKQQSKYSFNNTKFDSAPELAFYIWLSDNNVNFEYQPNIFFEYEFNQKIHRYYPDFIVEGQYIEIKGDHFFKEDGTMQ